MKGILLGVGVIILAVAAFIAVVWGMRTLNSVATSITVHEPEPGVHCALAVTADGVAIDCWDVE